MNWSREVGGFKPSPGQRGKNNVTQRLDVYFERSGLVFDPLERAYGDQAKTQEVASSKTRRGLAAVSFPV